MFGDKVKFTGRRPEESVGLWLELGSWKKKVHPRKKNDPTLGTPEFNRVVQPAGGK